jgi:WD domain, G-beta repeat
MPVAVQDAAPEMPGQHPATAMAGQLPDTLSAFSQDGQARQLGDDGARPSGTGPVPDAAPGALSNPAGTVSGSDGQAAGLDTPAAPADMPTQDVVTAGQRIRPALGPGGAARSAPRPRRRLLVIAVACAILAAAVALPVVLTMPGTPPAPSPSHSPSHAAARTSATTPPRPRQLTATLTDPGGAGVEGVAFGPAGTTLATGDANGSVYLWDTATGKLTATLTDPARGGGVQAVAFGPGGTTLATGDTNGSTYLWHLTR